MVDHVRACWQVSIRRACRALPVERSTYHYRSRRTGQAGLIKRIKEIAETRMRYGYRRIHVLLKREGWNVNPKRIYRLYKELGLQLRNKTPKRRVKAKLRDDRRPATRTNEIWAMDFVHDQLATGRKLRVLTIVDTFSRFSPGLDVRFNFRVVEVLEQVGAAMASPPASGSTKVPSSSAATSICGPISAVSRLTSPGQASPRTMPSSSRSTGSSGPNASTPTGS
jgi:putative transposase